MPGGLYHFGQRYTDTTTGRWTQQDPLDRPSDLTEGNRYRYTGDDPINNIDATGLLSCSTFGLGGACKTIGNALRAAGRMAIPALKHCGVGALAGALGVGGGLASVNLIKKGAGTFLVRSAGGPPSWAPRPPAA
jgi:uncharacterized protein RhaS with RHS repeats